MITECPECGNPVSDKAVSCPHCGYPVKTFTKPRARKKPNKRRRLPNGFGQISELKDRNLRKPFRVQVTIGKTDEGKMIVKPLKPVAYFETYNEAYQALLEYNKSPMLYNADITMEEIYEHWYPGYCESVEPGSSRHVKGAWNYCDSLKKMPIREVRARHIKQCIEEGTAIMNGQEKHTTPVIRRTLKTMFTKMFDYAIEYEIVERNYAKDYKLPKKDQKREEEDRIPHIPYTDEEIKILWDNVDKYPLVEIILFQCYSGWRPSEMGSLEVKNINMEEGTMVGGMKTEAGKNRIVPIHPRIRPFVENWYDYAVKNDEKYLICYESTRGRKSKELTYYRYNQNLISLVKKLGLNPQHRPHDGRFHFVTMAKKYNVDEYAIKYIIGHSIKDLTELIYTKRETAWLKTEIEKIK